MATRRTLMEIICCPVDRAELVLSVTAEKDDEIISGSLTCNKCGFAYPIENSIPNLLPPELQGK